MKIRIYITIIIFLVISISSHTHAQQYTWAKDFGSIYFDSGNSIDIDSFGNVITVGYFEDSVDFDPSANTLQLIASAQDIFVVKQDSDPHPIGQSNATSINASYDIFVAVYDSSGNFLMKEVPTGGGDDKGNAISADGFGKIVLTGAAASTFYMGPFQLINAGSYHPLVNPTDIFVAQMDNIPVGIMESKPDIPIVMFPNPAQDFLNIDNLSDFEQILIYDSFGKTVMEFDTIEGSKISISALKVGLYFICIRKANREYFVGKFVKM